MLLRPSHQIIPALSASLMPGEYASFLFSQRVLFTSHLDHRKTLILPPVSFTPIHYGPSNLPKGQSSERFSESVYHLENLDQPFYVILLDTLQFGFPQNSPAVYPFIYLFYALAKLAYLLSPKQVFYSCAFVKFPFFQEGRSSVPSHCLSLFCPSSPSSRGHIFDEDFLSPASWEWLTLSLGSRNIQVESLRDPIWFLPGL